MAKPKEPFYQDVDGFRLSGFFPIAEYKSALTYKPRSDDLFIVTYPKCGTTWLQVIVGSILNQGKPFPSLLEFMFTSPYLDIMGAEAAKSLKRPVAIKTHLPFRLAPWSPEAKYIFVARNPKDCVVSFYYHTKNFPLYKFQDGEFDDFFELFMEGKVEYGDYFDSLLSWYEHRNDKNVLFITYEQLKKDTKSYVLKIAEFMGSEYKEALESNPQMLEDVIRHSSIDYMREETKKSFEKLSNLPKEVLLNNPDIPASLRNLFTKFSFDSNPIAEFMRKGVVGDWKNHLSPTQNARLEQKFRERTMGTDIPDLWRDDM